MIFKPAFEFLPLKFKIRHSQSIGTKISCQLQLSSCFSLTSQERLKGVPASHETAGKLVECVKQLLQFICSSGEAQMCCSCSIPRLLPSPCDDSAAASSPTCTESRSHKLCVEGHRLQKNPDRKTRGGVGLQYLSSPPYRIHILPSWEFA